MFNRIHKYEWSGCLRFATFLVGWLCVFLSSGNVQAQISSNMRYNSILLGVHDLIGESAFMSSELTIERTDFLIDSLTGTGNTTYNNRLQYFHAAALFEMGFAYPDQGYFEVSNLELDKIMQVEGVDSRLFGYCLFIKKFWGSFGKPDFLDNLFLILRHAEHVDNYQLEFDMCFLISNYYSNVLNDKELSLEWTERVGEVLPKVNNAYNCNIYYTLEAASKINVEYDEQGFPIWESEEQQRAVLEPLEKAINCGDEILKEEWPFNHDVDHTYGVRTRVSSTAEEQIFYMKKALETRLGVPDKEFLSRLSLANTYMRHGQLDSAYAYLESVQNFNWQSFNFENRIRIELFQTMVNYYQRVGNQQDSLIKYMNLLYQTREEVANEEQLVKIEENKAKYNEAEQALQIERQKTSLANEEKRNANLSIIAIALVLIVILAIVFFYRLRKRKNQIEGMVGQLEENVKEKTVLIQEVNHRVKNNLQMIIAFLDAQVRNSEAAETIDFSGSIRKRIRAVSLVHELIVEEDRLSGMVMEEYVEELVMEMESLYYDKGLVFNGDFDPVKFGLSTTMYLGVLLNELLANSMKYAANEDEDLEIWIRFKTSEGGFVLNYRDSGGGIPEGAIENRKKSKSIGLSLIYSMVSQLQGKLEYDAENHFTFTFPKPEGIISID